MNQGTCLSRRLYSYIQYNGTNADEVAKVTGHEVQVHRDSGKLIILVEGGIKVVPFGFYVVRSLDNMDLTLYTPVEFNTLFVKVNTKQGGNGALRLVSLQKE